MRSCARLLLFVALLLPFRGALAVSGWLCHSDMTSSPAVAHAQHAGTSAVGHESEDADHGGCHGASEGQDHPGNHTPSCNLCSSICGAPAFPSSGPDLAGLPPPPAERFTALAPPRTEFALGVLERPPKSH
jgi:hypothetical protein